MITVTQHPPEPRDCANQLCRNKRWEGTWATVIVPNAEPHRPGSKEIKLSVCAPCAEYMERALCAEVERLVRQRLDTDITFSGNLG